MMIELPIGETSVEVEYPDRSVQKVLAAKEFSPAAAEERLVEEALSRPLDSAPLSEIVQQGETACIVVGDMTRLWVRHHLLLPPLLDELNRGGIPDSNICLLSATGDHREQTPEEHRRIAGDEACRRVRVYDHRARESAEMVYLGNTSRGTPVLINRKVVEADRVILTGGIVYHFLAGWGGGKKALLPGVAAYETIMKNHALAFLPGEGKGINPAVCAGKLYGNPCSEDMVEGASMVGPDFLVNTIINESAHRAAKVVAGNYLTAFEAGCKYVNEHCGVQIEGQAEVIFTSCGGYPKDINFYQTYKTLYNAHVAVQRGGTIILASESREGMGSDDFAAVFTSYADNQARESALRQNYTIGGYMGYHTAVIAEDHDVLVLSSLPDEQVVKMGMIPIKSLQQGLQYIKDKHGALPPAYFMPHGGSTLPFITA